MRDAHGVFTAFASGCGGNSTEPTSINQRGEVVGNRRLRLAFGGFMRDANGVFTHIVPESGNEIGVRGINARGEVVGYFWHNPPPGPDGFIYAKSKVVNSNLRLDRVITAMEKSHPGNDPHGLCRENDPTDPRTWRIYAVKPQFTNTSGTSLTGLTYVVRTLTAGNTLINADDAPPALGAGSTVSIQNTLLGPDGLLSPGESLVASNKGEASLYVCLASRSPFQLSIDIWGTPSP